jgi:hypothetical protein
MRYGQRGGDGPNTGKKATVYQVILPDGRQFKKRMYNSQKEELIATAFVHEGKVRVAVWMDEPAWEGEFGRLVAKKI